MRATCTKKEFKNWLLTKKSNAKVGVSCDSESCPLAHFFHSINDTSKDLHIDVENGLIQIFDEFDNTKKAETKLWMRKFITIVDSLGNFRSGYKVSAKKALEILANC